MAKPPTIKTLLTKGEVLDKWAIDSEYGTSSNVGDQFLVEYRGKKFLVTPRVKGAVNPSIAKI